MDITTKHREVLTMILYQLLDKDLINDPSQVAIGMLDLNEMKECYTYFSSDVFPILNFMHPLLKENKNSYKRQRSMYENIDENILLRDPLFKGINKDLNGIGKNYERLRRIKIQNSVSSRFFKDCLGKNISQLDKHILPNSLAYIETEPNGKLLVDLEEILFLWGNNPYYQCTFYNYKGNEYKVIYHTIIFCQESKCHFIAELVKKLLNDCGDVDLLEDINEKYEEYFKVDNNTIPIVCKWVSKIEEQLDSNIKLNSTTTANRDDWKNALRLFNDKKSSITEDNGESLLAIAKSNLPNDFIFALNKTAK